MNKKELIETFRGGLAYGRDYETVELLLDKKHTQDNKLCLQAYDANLIGLPSVSEWSTDAKKKLNDEVCRQTKDYNIDVYVDDVLIKQRKEKMINMPLTNEQHFRDLADAISEITDDIVKIDSNGVKTSSNGDRYCVKIIINEYKPVTSITFDMSKDNSITNKHIKFDTKGTDELIFSNLSTSDVENYNKVLTNLEDLIKKAKFEYQDAKDVFYTFRSFE